jgi:dolichol-phosphate mannosyltransferase
MQKTVSVVLPSYNEKENVEEAIERISKAVGDNLLEIIIVDDNSPDLTWKIVEDLNNPKVRLIRRITEKGLASALDDGVKAAKGDYIVWMDCDLGLPPEDIPRLTAPLENYDIVIGSRYVKGGSDLRPKWRSILSTVLNYYTMIMLSFKVKDYTSGFVALRRDVFPHVSWKREGFGEYFVEFAYKAIRKGYRITEVGYHFKDRTRGTSKSAGDLSTLFKYGWQYGVKVLKLRFSK